MLQDLYIYNMFGVDPCLPQEAVDASIPDILPSIVADGVEVNAEVAGA